MFNRTKNLYGRVVVAVALGLMLASSAAFAGSIDANAEGTVLPYRGMYFEHGHGGTGLTVDVDKNGYVFAVFYAYDKEGSPYYYLMEGFYEPSDPDTMIHTGVIGTLDTGAYVSEKGQCVGDGCTYRSPDRSDAHLPVHLTWTDPRKVHVQLGSQSWDITAEPYSMTVGDFISDDWIRLRTNYDPLSDEFFTETSSIRVIKTAMKVSDFGTCVDRDVGEASNFFALPSDAVIYSYANDYNYKSFLFTSSSSGTSGYFSVESCRGGYGKPASPGMGLMITGPNSFRIYAEYIFKVGPTEQHAIMDDRLIRMPPGSTLYKPTPIGF